MKVTTEDRVLKSLSLLTLFSTIIIKEDIIKICVALPLVAISMVLFLRKYLRAKKQGEPLGQYYMVLGFLLLTVFVGYLFYWYAISQ